MYNQIAPCFAVRPTMIPSQAFSQYLPNALEIVVAEGIKPPLSAFVARKIQLSINEKMTNTRLPTFICKLCHRDREVTQNHVALKAILAIMMRSPL